MSRIGADHLAREAIVYVRQSTIDQVINNVESRRRQYGLVERARAAAIAVVAGATTAPQTPTQLAKNAWRTGYPGTRTALEGFTA